MSHYTTSLRFLLENETPYDIGLNDYPLYTFKNVNKDSMLWGKDVKGQPITNYRSYLNNKIVEHYYFREIGLETPQLFRRFLSRKMNEIMPYYNQLYESIDIEFNPLWNVDLTETFTHTSNDIGEVEADGTSSTSSKNKITTEEKATQILDTKTDNNHVDTNVNTGTDSQILRKSDTPQSVVTDTDIMQSTYLTETHYNTGNNSNTTTDNSTDSGTNTGTVKNENNVDSEGTNTADTESNNKVNSTSTKTEEYTRHQQGSSAGYLFTQNIEQWRKIMINIDMQIIDELEQLFMQIW